MPFCRICNNERNNSEISAQEMMYGIREKFNYFKCSNCGCLQIENVPTDIAKYYPANYYSFNNVTEKKDFKISLKKIRDRFAVSDKGIVGRFLYWLRPNNRLRSLAKLDLQANTRILDVGCGSGSLLRSLQAIGFKNLSGVDPLISEDIHLGNGLSIKNKKLLNVGGIWDVVMFHHSFEHLLDQLGTLNDVKNILDDNGICLIRTPVVTSFAWNHYGVNWVQLDAPRHFYLHSIQSMSILARRAGFYIERTAYDSDSVQFWGSELYSKDIPLVDSSTGKPNSKAAFFTRSELKKYSVQAEKLNAAKNGDQAVFYLRKNPKSALPNFFIVGAAKAGTTSLYAYLKQHPDVYMSPIKEPNYFSSDIDASSFTWDYRIRLPRDLDAYFKRRKLKELHIAHIARLDHYCRLFENSHNKTARGEASVSYLYSSKAAENIKLQIPDAKIIMVLRNPIERAYSHYLMDLRDGFTSLPFKKALEADRATIRKGWGLCHLYIELGMYYEQVKRFTDIFPIENVRIYLYEDLTDIKVLMKDTYRFLSVDDAFIPNIETKHNAAMIPKNAKINYYLKNSPLKFISHSFPNYIIDHLRKYLMSDRRPEAIPSEDKNELKSIYKNDIEKLEGLINRDLSSWVK